MPQRAVMLEVCLLLSSQLVTLQTLTNGSAGAEGWLTKYGALGANLRLAFTFLRHL